MPEEFPLPLVPAEVDLTDFGFMPLDVRRLRDSRIAASATGDEFRAAVLLWCASWHQKPAASIPDDDVELAQLAGYGRVIKEWRKVKAGAMHGWIKCSDGRFYHPVIAEKANEGWLAKLDQAWSKECDRIRKENKRRAETGETLIPMPSRPKRNSDRGQNGIPLEAENISAGIPAENALKGQGQGEIREKNITSSASVAGPPSAGPPSDAAPIDLDFVKEILAIIGKPEGNLVNEIATPPRWRAAGYTPAEIRQAAEIARARQQNVRNLKYLDAIIDGLRADAIPNSSGSKPPAQVADHKPLSEDDWSKRLATWKSSGLAWPLHWGPEPGKPGCVVPARLLEDADRMVPA
jgi:hypothetical protein